MFRRGWPEFGGDDAKREETLKRLFSESGCNGEHLSEQPVKHARRPNLICTLPGATDSIIVVGAHYDHVERGSGVVDNWSGASLLPTLLKSLSSPHPFLPLSEFGHSRSSSEHV